MKNEELSKAEQTAWDDARRLCLMMPEVIREAFGQEFENPADVIANFSPNQVLEKMDELANVPEMWEAIGR